MELVNNIFWAEGRVSRQDRERILGQKGVVLWFTGLSVTVLENKKGRGPCYLQTKGITKEQEQDLYKAYLNIAPAQTLKWIEEG